MVKKSKHDEKGGRYFNSYDEKYHVPMAGMEGRAEIVTNTDDLTAVLNTAISSLRTGCCKYPDSKEGLAMFKQKAIDYLQYINDTNAKEGVENRVYPDIEGLAVFCGTTRKTICLYEKRSEEWAELIGFVKTCIASAKKQLGNTYKIPPVLAIFDLANNHNYKNVSEFRIEAERVDKRDIAPSIPDLARKYITTEKQE